MKIKLIVLLLFASVLLILYLFEKYSYPITYKVCSPGYVDCQIVAKYKERDDCETTNKRWDWLCDQNDKSNIICQEEESTIAIGYCD